MKKALAYILSLCLLLSAPVYAHTADLPFASIPDTPPGMQACSIEDFVYFIWDDWSEFESDHSMKKAINKAYHLNSEAPEQIHVSYIDCFETVKLSPDEIMSYVILYTIMSHTNSDAELPVYEQIRLRNIEGMMVSENGTAIWMSQQGNDVVCIILDNTDLSGPECRSRVLQVLGVTENQIEIIQTGNTNIL